MEKVPFNPQEMVAPVRVVPAMFGMPERRIWDSPITPGQNLIMACKEHDAMFLPSAMDCNMMNTRILADNKARATVMDGLEPFTPNLEGEKDVFGVTWLYEPVLNGSMVKPGNALFDDANDWEAVLKFPNPDEWDWEGAAKASEEHRSDPLNCYKATIFTGFYERLISFMDFEDAAVAMIDDEQQDAVKALFDRLADLYICYVDHFAKDFKLDGVELHDDWGSQMAPFMAPSIIEEMVVPSLKRVADRVHEHGMWFQQHSCGRIERLVPLMIEAGVDMWMGQDINDKAQCIKDYGDKIVIECEAPECGEDADEETVREAVEEWAKDHLIPGKACCLSIYSASRKNPAVMTDVLYEVSRKAYCC